MPITPDEFETLCRENPGLIAKVASADPQMAPVLQAGAIAIKREAARKLLEYARGRMAAALATHDDELRRLEQEHLAPVRQARQAVDASANQQIAQLEAALDDLAADRDASLPTQDQIDAAIVPFGG